MSVEQRQQQPQGPCHLWLYSKCLVWSTQQQYHELLSNSLNCSSVRCWFKSHRQISRSNTSKWNRTHQSLRKWLFLISPDTVALKQCSVVCKQLWKMREEHRREAGGKVEWVTTDWGLLAVDNLWSHSWCAQLWFMWKTFSANVRTVVMATPQRKTWDCFSTLYQDKRSVVERSRIHVTQSWCEERSGRPWAPSKSHHSFPIHISFPSLPLIWLM